MPEPDDFLAPPSPAEEGEFTLPSYSTPGRILVRVGPTESTVYKFEYEVLEYDGDTCVFWIEEGEGFDYWCDTLCEFPAEGGVFVIEGITGYYHRGDGWTSDDAVDWEYSVLRPATEAEIAEETLTPLASGNPPGNPA